MRKVILILALSLAVALPGMAEWSTDHDRALSRVERVSQDFAKRAAARDPLKTKFFTVDCTLEPKSINQILKHPADVLVIDVRGMCEENVLIQRSNVTLRGADPLSDGIVGFYRDTTPTEPATIAIRNGSWITLENLTITGDAGTGVYAEGSVYVMIQNSRIVDNPVDGLQVWPGALAIVQDTVIQGNGGSAVLTDMGGAAALYDTTVRDNFNGVVSFNGNVFMRDSAVSDNFLGQIYVTDGHANIGRMELSGAWPVFVAESHLIIFESTVNTTEGFAFVSFNNTVLDMYGTEFSGPIWAADGGILNLWSGSVNTANSGTHIAVGQSKFELAGGSVLLGDAEIDSFSNMVIGAGCLHDGDIVCGSGADTWCADSTTVSGSCNCEHCLVP